MKEEPVPMPARIAALAGKLEVLLIPLVVVVGAIGIAVPGPARSADAAGVVNPTLAVLVFTAGLTVEAAGLGRARRRGLRVITALAVSSLVLPALAWALSHVVSGAARGGILAVGVAPSEVASLGLAAMAGGEAAISAALLVSSSVVAVVVSGPILSLTSGTADVHTGGVLVTLALVVGLPLAAGVVLRRLVADSAATLDSGRLVGTAALLVLLWEVAGEVQLRTGYLAVVAALIGFLVGSGALGWLLALGLGRTARPAVLLPVAMRDFAVAAGIAASAFGPGAVGPLGIYGLLVLLGGALATRFALRPGCAGVHDPSTAEELLRSARTESFRDLKARAARAKRQARGEEEEQAREARAHAGRYFRSWEPEEGGVRLEAWLTKREGAQVLMSIEAEASKVFREARTGGIHEPHERYRADALVRVCRGDAQGPVARVLVRVDAGALTRGNVQPGEVCEIPGVGPVPVATARELMGDAVFNVLVSDGIDVTCVTSTKRTIPASLRVALMERDPVCVVPGCTAAQHLEIDHWQRDFKDDGPTRLSNLARLCKPHHDLHSDRGWHLEGGPGQWRWIGPGGKAPPDSTAPGPDGRGPSDSRPSETIIWSG